jgi:hypothetical protein
MRLARIAIAVLTGIVGVVSGFPVNNDQDTDGGTTPVIKVFVSSRPVLHQASRSVLRTALLFSVATKRTRRKSTRNALAAADMGLTATRYIANVKRSC